MNHDVQTFGNKKYLDLAVEGRASEELWEVHIQKIPKKSQTICDIISKNMWKVLLCLQIDGKDIVLHILRYYLEYIDEKGWWKKQG